MATKPADRGSIVASARAALARAGRWLSLLSLAICLSGIGSPDAADIAIYEKEACEQPAKVRFIFIVDNSGSMSATDFTNSKATVDAASRHVLSAGLPGVKVAVVQYGTVRGAVYDHRYEVTVPFTSDPGRATDWERRSSVLGYEDHLPGSLAAMRQDGVYGPGGALDIGDASSVQFVIFTDAWAETGGCCSVLVHGERSQSSGLAGADVWLEYGEYDALKSGEVLPDGVKAQISMLHAAPSVGDSFEAAAIASAGGEFTGEVAENPADPDGAGTVPRRYIVGDLTLDDVGRILSLLDILIEEAAVSSTFSSPAISASNVLNTRHRDQLYYSLFQPGDRRDWPGNIKSYRMDEQGVLVDARGEDAIDPATGAFSSEARSEWSSEADGASVVLGGYAGRLGLDRPWYTDPGGELRRVSEAEDVPVSAFGAAATPAQRDAAVDWSLGADPHDLNDNSDREEAGQYVGDGLHSSPLLVTLARRGSGRSARAEEVLFATTNRGRLHAIDPDSGDELWSYTPAELLPSLLGATDERAGILDHAYGLDGPLVYYPHDWVEGTGRSYLREGYLYMGQRRGGSGLFAVEISDALAEREPLVVAWKIRGGEGEFIDMGQSWARPLIASVATDCGSGCRSRPVLVVSGGYNPAYDDPRYRQPVPPAKGHGNAVYLIDPLSGERLWSAGQSGVHDLQLDMADSIPAAPVVIDTNGDGDIDVLFVLDIAGKLWRVDFDPRAASLGRLHRSGGLIADMSGREDAALRFFNSPDVAILGDGLEASYFHIAFGSGARDRPLVDEPGRNAVYFVRDPWVRGAPMAMGAGGVIEADYRYVIDGERRSVITPAVLQPVGGAASEAPVKHGYLAELGAVGEKVLTATLTIDGRTLLVSYVPPAQDDEAAEEAEKSCAYALGTSRLYVFNTRSNRFELIPASGAEFMDIATGITPQIQLLDTGPDRDIQVVTGIQTHALNELLDIDRESALRQFNKTAWEELDSPSP